MYMKRMIFTFNCTHNKLCIYCYRKNMADHIKIFAQKNAFEMTIIVLQYIQRQEYFIYYLYFFSNNIEDNVLLPKMTYFSNSESLTVCCDLSVN